MPKDTDLSIFDELDDRLDGFFAEDGIEEDAPLDDFSGDVPEDVDTPPLSTNPSTTPPEMVGPLHDLKATVLEMDWEISDENLHKYLSEIKRLMNLYRTDRPIYLFFKLHSAIGTYMLCKKARAHPHALKFLYSVYNSLEAAMTSDLSTLEKNRLILTEVNNFKLLKNTIFPVMTSHSDSSVLSQSSVSGGAGGLKSDGNFDFASLPDSMRKHIDDYIAKTVSKRLAEERSRL